MRVSKAPFKKVVDIIKRENDSKNKESGQMMIQCYDGETILCYGKTANLFSFHTLKNLDGTTFSFIVNPFELYDRLGGKDKEKEYVIDAKGEQQHLIEKGGGEPIPVRPYEKEVSLPFSEFVPLKNPEEFKELLTNAEKILNDKSEKVASAYLKFGSKSAFTADPICLQHFRMDELFPFETGFLHLDQIKLLNKSFVNPTKSVRSELSFSIYNYALVIKNEVEPKGKGKENDGQTNYFMLKINHEIPFPKFDLPEEEEQRVLSLRINADDMNELLSFYTADCKDFYLYEKNGMIVIDPYGKKPTDESMDEGEEKHPITWIRADVTQGEFRRYKINANALKNLFTGYSGEIEVYQVLESKNEEDTMLIWRVYSPYRISSILGKTEPNYEKVDKIIAELEKKRQAEQEKRKRSAS